MKEENRNHLGKKSLFSFVLWLRWDHFIMYNKIICWKITTKLADGWMKIKRGEIKKKRKRCRKTMMLSIYMIGNQT